MKRLHSGGIRLAQGQGPLCANLVSWTPQRVLIPLPPREAGTVPAGTRVKKWALLGEQGGFAPEEGVVWGYQEISHPLIGKTLCTVLLLDSREERADKGKKKNPKGNPKGEISQAARQAGIVDECSGEPLWKVIEQMRDCPPQWLAADVLEDDPAKASGALFFAENSKKALRGLKALADAVGVKGRVVWNSPWLEETCSSLPGEMSLRLPGKYPAWELCREASSARRVGVQALAALADALESGVPQTHTAILLQGDLLPEPLAFWVPIGTTVGDLLEHCGAATRPCQVHMGGLLTGRSVLEEDTPIVPASRGLTVESPAKQRLDERVFPCIGCGSCQASCPAGLAPWAVQDALSREPVAQHLLGEVEDCCQCGVCRAVCPSGIDLMACMRQAAELRKRGGLV